VSLRTPNHLPSPHIRKFNLAHTHTRQSTLVQVGKCIWRCACEFVCVCIRWHATEHRRQSFPRSCKITNFRHDCESFPCRVTSIAPTGYDCKRVCVWWCAHMIISWNEMDADTLFIEAVCCSVLQYVETKWMQVHYLWKKQTTHIPQARCTTLCLESANMQGNTPHPQQTQHPQHTATHLTLDAEDTDSFGAVARAERMVRGAELLDSLTSLKANTGTAAAAAAGASAGAGAGTGASTAEGATAWRKIHKHTHTHLDLPCESWHL